MSDREIRSYSKSIEESDPTRIRSFDTCFRPQGGRLLDVDHDTQWFRLRYWDYAQKFRAIPAYAPYLTNFHFDLINNKGLNAIASRCDGVYLIGFYHGAVRNLQAFFTMALSSPEILPQIGEPKRETRWLRSLSECSWVDPLEQVIAHAQTFAAPPPDFPLDPARKVYAHRLAILALDFLFFHELGHLINGHLEYLDQAGVGCALAEVRMSRSAGVSDLDYHALEINADSSSALIMTQEWFRLEERLPPGSTFPTVTEAIESLVLALTAVFLMFDPGGSTLAHYRTTSHPHPAVRLMNVYFSTCQAAQQVSGKALKNLEKAWKAGLQRAEALFSHLGMGAALWHAVATEDRLIHPEYLSAAKRFQEINRVLRPDLRRFEE